jgi:hypothetical protein
MTAAKPAIPRKAPEVHAGIFHRVVRRGDDLVPFSLEGEFEKTSGMCCNRNPPTKFASSQALTRAARLTHLTASAVLGIVLGACGSESGDPTGTGGSTAGPSAGTGGTMLPPTAGTSSTAGSGGAPAGGAPAGGNSSAGAPGGGGGASGGSQMSGGAPNGGGGAGTGGASGGAGGAVTTAGSAGMGGAVAGTCQKGTTKGNEVLFIGESFIAASSIPEETTKLARAAGSLGANDSYVDKSVSGTWIGNGAANSIPNQYKNNASGVRFVLMNGGGNDCWQGGKESDRTNALNAAKQLFTDMAAKDVEKVVYFFYADPIGSQFAALKSCLDVLRPAMKSLCDGQGSPKCYWVDLRDTWNGHPEYTSDGIHVAGPGNAPTAAAIFKSMQQNCVAP